MKNIYCGFVHNTIIHLKHIINISVCIYREREMTKATMKEDIHHQMFYWLIN